MVKAWCTDLGCEVASIGMQVHGGMGFIEETGAAQHLSRRPHRADLRGHQRHPGQRLVGRKLARDNGAAARDFIAAIRASDRDLAAAPGAELAPIRASLAEATATLSRCTDWMVETHGANPALALAGATPYLRLFGTVAGGWLMAMAALAALRRLGRAKRRVRGFLKAKLATARFYADNILAEADGLATQITRGGESLLALPAELF